MAESRYSGVFLLFLHADLMSGEILPKSQQNDYIFKYNIGNEFLFF